MVKNERCGLYDQMVFIGIFIFDGTLTWDSWLEFSVKNGLWEGDLKTFSQKTLC